MATKATKTQKTAKKSSIWTKIKNGISILFLIFAILFFFNSDIMLGILVILMWVTFNPFTYKRIEKLRKKDFKLFHKILTFAASFILFFVVLVATTHSLQEQTNKDMAMLYDEIVERSELDQKMEKYAQKEDSKLFKYALESQEQWQIVLDQVYIIIDDLDKQEQYATLGIFSSKVYAKKRRSMWYYVPLLWRLVKWKHQTLETARANLYEAITDPKYKDRWMGIANKYWITDAEQLRTLGDMDLERLARDPELNWFIDFAKITKDLWVVAVNTVVEASQMVTAGKLINPISDTKDNFIEDLKDWKIDTVWEDLKSKDKWILRVQQDFQKTTKIVLWVKKEVIAKIPQAAIAVHREWMWEAVQEAVDQALANEKAEPFIVIHKTKLPDLALKIDAWDRDIISSDEEDGITELWDISIDAWYVTDVETNDDNLTLENHITLQKFISEYKTKPISTEETKEIEQQKELQKQSEKMNYKDVIEEDVEILLEKTAEVQETEEEEYTPEFDDNSYQEGYTYIYGVESTTERIIYYNECSSCFSYGLVCHEGSAGSYCCGADDWTHHGQCDTVSEVDYRWNESEDANDYWTIFDTDRVSSTNNNDGDGRNDVESLFDSEDKVCNDNICIIWQKSFDENKLWR